VKTIIGHKILIMNMSLFFLELAPQMHPLSLILTSSNLCNSHYTLLLLFLPLLYSNTYNPTTTFHPPLLFLTFQLNLPLLLLFLPILYSNTSIPTIIFHPTLLFLTFQLKLEPFLASSPSNSLFYPYLFLTCPYLFHIFPLLSVYSSSTFSSSFPHDLSSPISLLLMHLFHTSALLSHA